MNKNIIKNIDTDSITKSRNRETLFFPVSLNKKNALLHNVKFLKIVVLPSSFNPNSIFQDNLPLNINKSFTSVNNDMIIDKEEVGNNSTPSFVKNVFSKNIVSNLSQRYFPNFEVFIDNEDSSLLQEFIVNIPISRIDLSLKGQRVDFDQNPLNIPVVLDYELPHYFIIYALDKDENILEYVTASPTRIDKKIVDYENADPEVIKESFIDEFGGNMDINWISFTFNDTTNEILTGPDIRLNYTRLLEFIESIEEEISYIDISLSYANEKYSESFFTSISLEPFNVDFSSAIEIARARKAMSLSFINSFSQIEFNEIIGREDTEDVSDYFENKFIVNLYKSFEELNLEEQETEITISMNGHSYTKDIVIKKENFYNFYTKYLEYNKEAIIRKTINQQITCENTVNDLGFFVSKVSVRKFNYKNYSLNVLNNNSFFEFRSKDIDVNELFFDDNCTFNNSLKAFSGSKFYIDALFNSENVSDFYFKNNNVNNEIIDIIVDRFSIATNLLGQRIVNNEPESESDSSEFLRNIDPLNITERVDTLNRPNIRGIFGNIRRPINPSIRESLLQNSTVLIQRNLALSTNVRLNQGIVRFSTDQKNLNTKLINDNLSIPLNEKEITDETRLLELNNNVITTFKYFSKDNKFMGTKFKRNVDIKTVDDHKEINLLEGINNSGPRIGRLEFKNFILSNNIIDNLCTNASGSIKQELCRILVDAKPSKYHYIVKKIEDTWFKENSDINVVINQIGELLSSSNLENTIEVLSKETKVSAKNKKTFTNKTKIKRKKITNSKKLNIKKVSKVKSTNIIDHMFNFGFNNIDSKQIKSNLIFDINENFVIKKKNKNKKHIYEIDLKLKSEFSNDLKSDSFRALNIYSFYGFEYYNKNITNKKENITGLNITPNGCIIDKKFVEIISNFKFKINNDKVLIDNQKTKTLNYNEDYYNLVKTIWENSKNLNVKAIINRILFEVVLKNGEKKYYGFNQLINYNKEFNKFKSANSKSNLSIDINNNRLRNPNMILLFGK